MPNARDRIRLIQPDPDGVLLCSAPRKNPRRMEDQCRGFVGRFAAPVRVVGLVAHSSLIEPGHEVFPCRRCGFLHEIERLEDLPQAA